jgi:4-diphosphocytidyl-2-C-methyl-D-erythritol kinase
MAVIEEFARPKVNLSLRVLGRRGDGYHELESLVAFARHPADVIRFEPGAEPAVAVEGAFGSAIATENLVLRTLQLAAETDPGLTLGAVTLQKNLPVAAGIGGGSADAAATLRALRRANPVRAPHIDWHALARRLGADVSVCLENRAAWMRGIGDRLAPLSRPIGLHAVLVNRLQPAPDNKTAEVFRRLAAPPLPTNVTATVRDNATAGESADGPDLLAALARTGNDLERPAIGLMPEIADTLAAVAATGGCRLARMSGAGPTVFGLYGTHEEAHVAAQRLREQHPRWWVVATILE